MSESTVISGASGVTTAWFGKLPSQGDFVGRRMPHALVAAWDEWMRSGLHTLRNDAPQSWEQRFVHSPLWFFISPAAIMGVPAIGVLAPSVDRVGRCYPICVVATTEGAAPGYATDQAVVRFLTGAREAVVNARRLPLAADQFDAQLSQLCSPFSVGPTAGGAGLIDALLADLHGAQLQASGSIAELPNVDWRTLHQQSSAATVWWISPTPQFPRDELIHHGPLGRPLFGRLFKGLPQAACGAPHQA